MPLHLLPFFPAICALAAPTNEASVRNVVAGFATAWNIHDMTSFGKLFAPDADFVNVGGSWLKGREDIQMNHAFYHGTIPADSPSQVCNTCSTNVKAGINYGIFKTSTMRFIQIDVCFLQKDAAVAHASWELLGDARSPKDPRRGLSRSYSLGRAAPG